MVCFIFRVIIASIEFMIFGKRIYHTISKKNDKNKKNLFKLFNKHNLKNYYILCLSISFIYTTRNLYYFSVLLYKKLYLLNTTLQIIGIFRIICIPCQLVLIPLFLNSITNIKKHMHIKNQIIIIKQNNYNKLHKYSLVPAQIWHCLISLYIIFNWNNSITEKIQYNEYTNFTHMCYLEPSPNLNDFIHLYWHSVISRYVASCICGFYLTISN